MGTKKIAIACQGGGTHAAFSWGVLAEILRTKKAWDASRDEAAKFDIATISGTSAGALCALATWYGLSPNGADSQCGTIDKAIERLDFLWTTFAAATPVEIYHNKLVSALLGWKARGVPLPGSNPYDEKGALGLAGLSLMGARREYLDFPALLQSVCPHFGTIDWPAVAKADLRILVGAIEVVSGNFEVFDSDKTLEEMGLRPRRGRADQPGATRWRMRRPFSLEGVAASGTLPEVLPAQEVEDTTFPTCDPGKTISRTAYYWDGLYSQNPPVRDLVDMPAKRERPDEIWVVRINPQEGRAPDSAMGLEGIRDRENELAGNLSLNQELDQILRINGWIERYGEGHPPLSSCKVVKVRTIKMTHETARTLLQTSKFDRDAGHLARLRDEGSSVVGQWLRDWRSQGAQFPEYPDDARYPETC